jgi:hypothetical protein
MINISLASGGAHVPVVGSRPATVGFLLAGCLAGGPGERNGMRPSVVGVSADPGDTADLGNDCRPDAVAERVRKDALRSDIF